ncbi:MAG: hypothetical protein CMO26_14210 [Thiotrichales bacterium]|nr:hypothetical protein [Thiotrichales bacterium]
MRITYNLMAHSWHDMTNIAAACEESGLHAIAVADSPLVGRELYVASAACLQATETLTVMSAVTNPLTRHPSVTAAAVRSLCDISPGRVTVGIATGDSAAWGAGLRPARIAVLREYIIALKALLRGEEASWQGQQFRLHWDDARTEQVPAVLVACSGPKVLRMATEVADGIIPAMGYAQENIDYVRKLVDNGCRANSRDPDEFDIWWYADVSFGVSAEVVCETQLASDAQWLVVGGTEGKLIPPEYIPLLQQMHADGHDIQTSYKNPNRGRQLVERAKGLGLYDWLYERDSRLHGTAEEIGQRLRELGSRGIDQWCLWQDGGDYPATELPAALRRALDAGT